MEFKEKASQKRKLGAGNHSFNLSKGEGFTNVKLTRQTLSDITNVDISCSKERFNQNDIIEIADDEGHTVTDKSTKEANFENNISARKERVHLPDTGTVGSMGLSSIDVGDSNTRIKRAKGWSLNSNIRESTLSNGTASPSSSNIVTSGNLGSSRKSMPSVGPGRYLLRRSETSQSHIGVSLIGSNESLAGASTAVINPASFISKFNETITQAHIDKVTSRFEEEIVPELSTDSDDDSEESNLQYECSSGGQSVCLRAPCSSEYSDLGDATFLCEFCGAKMWYGERTTKWYNPKKPKFSLCCGQGKIQLPDLDEVPELLLRLIKGKDKRSRYFQKNIRSFNSMFSFTSLGGRIDSSMNQGRTPPVFVMNGEVYHRIGSLLPIEGEQPRFAQMYIYDTEHEISNRLASVRMDNDSDSLQASIVQEIKQMLDRVNPFVKQFRLVKERISLGHIPNIKLRIIGKRSKDGRQYNLPTVKEVAALIVGDFDSGEDNRDIIVEERHGNLQRVKVLNPAYLPLQYPLIFPCGEDGYRDDISLRELPSTKNMKRKRVSMREWFAYRIQHRTRETSTLLFSKRLFQQFLVDAFSMIESSRLLYVRTHQSELRAELYGGLCDAIFRGETEAVSVGKRIILPSSFTGGARYMFQNYQDAMGICRWAGYPDLFITFTCNHKWPEISRYLEEEECCAEDRPDVACRVFKQKLETLLEDIQKEKLFGKVVAVVYTIEFQKRGLPHAHILIFLHSQNKYPTPSDIDQIISAEIPNKEVDPDLYEIVQNLMIHGPCGYKNRKAPCMDNGKCARHFPKRFVDKTVIDDDGYPVYMRRNNGSVVQKGKTKIDNRFVVPYNKTLLLRYNAHINVEWCNQSRSVKYLFKYINKGTDRVTASFYEAANNSTTHNVVDEIKLYYDCRYLSACEAAWRIFAFQIHDRDPPGLPIHEENNHAVILKDNQTIEEGMNRPFSHITKFIAWMEANAKYEEARNLLYAEFPMKFVWKAQQHEWTPRKMGFSIGRVHFVPPGSGELYYLRLLINVQRGCVSYDEIKTVKGVLYNTFKEACFAFGLLEDDKEYISGIKEASYWASARFLRRLFATLLVAYQFTSPDVVWENTWVYLSDDILFRQRAILKSPDLRLSEAQIKNLTLFEIQRILESNNKSLAYFDSMPQLDESIVNDAQNGLILDELNYDSAALGLEKEQLLSKMTSEQKSIYDTIMEAVNTNLGGLFFLYGYGGTGKTFLWRAIAATIRLEGEIVLTVASSGIAALLIPGGRTAHSRFTIPINVNEDSTCNIRQGSPLAKLIIRAKLIIWDEAPMCHKHAFEALDKTMRDILRFANPDGVNLPFGGKVVVLGGDFRQILPVVPKGTRQDIIYATINSSYLWNHCKILNLTKNMRLQGGQSATEVEELSKFSEWILGIGDGTVGDEVNDEIKIQIPSDLLIKCSDNPIIDIVHACYPNFLENMSNLSFFTDRAILAPTNEVVDKINEYMLSLVPSEERIYLSCDSPCPSDSCFGVQDSIHTPEFLNSIKSSGIPNHELKLKVGVPIMLLRNIDPADGMCNGTRMIVTRLSDYVIEATATTGTNAGKKVLIARHSLTPSDARIPFKFRRRQFPIAISFAMTINKSQGQSMNHVGIYLPKPVFTHGQLYVAMSRVTNRQGLKLLVLDDEGRPVNEVTNVVYKEVFRNLNP